MGYEGLVHSIQHLATRPSSSAAPRSGTGRGAGEEVEDDLTKAEASIKIDELREKAAVDDAAPKQKGSNKAAE